ncbi:serine/threonine protein kinase [Thermodesulfobacteriota bacterium]
MMEPIFIQGQRVEDYQVEKQMAKSPMAELFLARDVLLERRVVIKVLSQSLIKREFFKEQFLREARIQANLDNPHIVPIFRIFTYKDFLCLVMRYIKGTDLAAVVKMAQTRKGSRGENGALSMERAVHIFLQILEGIGFAHKYNIVHGDIKPANILLDEQGRAKVADFGLSFLLSDGEEGKKDILPAGTPHYMSPEQILNEKVDFRSDIYSLGATFFNMITGEVPLGKHINTSALLEFHMEGSLDGVKQIFREQNHIPEGIKAAILKSLGKNPEDRYQSCLEFSLAIKGEAPYELYSELLRHSLLSKNDITQEERSYLSKIAVQRGLGLEEMRALEDNIRMELGLPKLTTS